MIRLIKRYESRKLYDTEESRYVSLEEISTWIREGQEVRVVDNATSADVTSQTLTQIILDEGRRGTSFLPSELLHELVRLGEKAMHSGVEQVQHGVDRLVQASVDRLGPVRRAREEMSRLRSQLERLESSLAHLESDRPPAAGSAAAAAGAASAPRGGAKR
jgi:polyhydroxyalkanoate synthesis repressor PhaR